MLRWSLFVLLLLVLTTLLVAMVPYVPADFLDPGVHTEEVIESPEPGVDPADEVYDSSKMRCWDDAFCGKGECWEGRCQPSGFCVAYYSCV